MKQQAVTTPLSTDALLEVLFPILRKLHARRSISSGKLAILRHLAEHGRATTAELASAIHVSPQGISLAVREMEALGFLSRVQDDTDRRKMWLQLSATGQQKLSEESSAAHEWLDRAISDRLTPEEQGLLGAAIPVLRIIGQEAENV
ncbi:MarR family winged helix-turn-helix transcriptional regulator [Arthrobacter psychrolactophilus]